MKRKSPKRRSKSPIRRKKSPKRKSPKRKSPKRKSPKRKSPIYKNMSPAPPTLKKGAAAAAGLAYEHRIANFLNSCVFNGVPITDARVMGGSTALPDVVFTHKGREVKIEAKTSINAEFGQCKIIRQGDKWIGNPDNANSAITTAALSSISIPRNYEDETWKRRMTIDEWRQHSGQHKDMRVPVDPNAISDNYGKIKGVNYIMIQGVGLFLVGEDILELGVPWFTLYNVFLRLRIKVNASGKGGQPCSLTFTSALKIQNPRQINSKYSIDGLGSRVLPGGFALKSKTNKSPIMQGSEFSPSDDWVSNGAVEDELQNNNGACLSDKVMEEQIESFKRLLKF